MAATPHDLSLRTSLAGRRERLRSIIGGSAGNVIEWYDFLAYSIFSIYFSKAFFPGGNQTAQLLNAAAVAAIGYVVRPLGSWAIGALADRHGRRVALSVSAAMMSIGSLIIALTPTYATIGVAAPGMLVCARPPALRYLCADRARRRLLPFRLRRWRDGRHSRGAAEVGRDGVASR
ncbi:Sugar transporter [Paraburkholderia diazotrophica]|uniref:Sugar transporter n=1 Tax=Paraburkholderia diazotrophica TaxID=667676 RepID=A0A1H7BH35_9BURK|nr:Sugar transporter [Paraburkholderia diazotrophica]